MSRSLRITLIALAAFMILAAGFAAAPLPTGSVALTITMTPSPVPPPDAQDAQPVLVWTVFDPWLPVVGADSPAFALYDNGLVIFRTEDGYRWAQLDARQQAAFLKALPVKEFFALDDYYDAAGGWTDQPSHTISLWRGKQRQTVTVYGNPAIEEVRPNVPAPFAAILDQIAALHPRGARPWLPDKIEVLIWPYDTSPDSAAAWPEDWPDLDDPTTVARNNGQYSLFLDARRLEEFRALMQESGGVALIDGKTWAVSYRLPFPQEQAWMDSGSGD